MLYYMLFLVFDYLCITKIITGIYILLYISMAQNFHVQAAGNQLTRVCWRAARMRRVDKPLAGERGQSAYRSARTSRSPECEPLAGARMRAARQSARTSSADSDPSKQALAAGRVDGRGLQRIIEWLGPGREAGRGLAAVGASGQLFGAAGAATRRRGRVGSAAGPLLA